MDKRRWEDKRLHPDRLEDKSGRSNRPNVGKKRGEQQKVKDLRRR